ncbi:hypothetical protein ACFQ0B_37835 [Nonomuraea thailandensis]
MVFGPLVAVLAVAETRLDDFFGAAATATWVSGVVMGAGLTLAAWYPLAGTLVAALCLPAGMLLFGAPGIAGAAVVGMIGAVSWAAGASRSAAPPWRWAWPPCRSPSRRRPKRRRGSCCSSRRSCCRAGPWACWRGAARSGRHSSRSWPPRSTPSARQAPRRRSPRSARTSPGRCTTRSRTPSA